MEGKICWNHKITSVQKGKEAGQGQKESEEEAHWPL